MTGESSKLNVTNKEGWQFWIDRGGTFTDLIGVSPNGNQVVRKVLSDQPGKPGDPAVNVIRDVLELKGKDPIPKGIIKEVRIGTTVATNALLERKGEKTVLITTKGFRDLLQIGNQNRPKIFDLEIRKLELLYQEVIEVDERVRILNKFSSEKNIYSPEIVEGTTGERFEILKKPNLKELKIQLKNITI